MKGVKAGVHRVHGIAVGTKQGVEIGATVVWVAIVVVVVTGTIVVVGGIVEGTHWTKVDWIQLIHSHS